MKKLSIIIPCYQNEENVTDLITALIGLFDQLKLEFALQVIFVDDGSSDNTFQELLQQRKNLKFESKLVKLSGNFGSYNALLAGLNHADGDCFVQLHADLQDPPDYIPEMLTYWQRGFKLVIAQRLSRQGFWLSQLPSKLYHLLIRKLAMPYVPTGGYDLILFDLQIKDEVVAIGETNTNLVYLISWLRFPYVTIPIERKLRTKGKSQWTFWAKQKLFVDSFVSFSYTPIRLISLGAFSSLIVWVIVSLLYLFSIVHLQFINWVLLTISVFSYLSMAIIGEYVWRALEASRKRPPYVVDKIID